ncbi:hypothetical protein BKA62DRAFT_769999 [Auriculariales sp. MPI-PUGE-AT-0066]|nr:hypothetical protein BKA62DRAFT_769999 [Auriculariales sp. MPI-PUGE-AT-0066]
MTQGLIRGLELQDVTSPEAAAHSSPAVADLQLRRSQPRQAHAHHSSFVPPVQVRPCLCVDPTGRPRAATLPQPVRASPTLIHHRARDRASIDIERISRPSAIFGAETLNDFGVERRVLPTTLVTNEGIQPRPDSSSPSSSSYGGAYWDDQQGQQHVDEVEVDDDAEQSKSRGAGNTQRPRSSSWSRFVGRFDTLATGKRRRASWSLKSVPRSTQPEFTRVGDGRDG